MQTGGALPTTRDAGLPVSPVLKTAIARWTSADQFKKLGDARTGTPDTITTAAGRLGIGDNSGRQSLSPKRCGGVRNRATILGWKRRHGFHDRSITAMPTHFQSPCISK